MKYRISINDTVLSGLMINFIPENRTLSMFFQSIKIAQYPELLMNINNSVGYVVENATFLFYSEMDWEDKEGLEIKKDEVCIYVYDGKPNEIVIKEYKFLKILLDFSMQLYTTYQNEPNLLGTWQQKMQYEIV